MGGSTNANQAKQLLSVGVVADELGEQVRERHMAPAHRLLQQIGDG